MSPYPAFDPDCTAALRPSHSASPSDTIDATADRTRDLAPNADPTPPPGAPRIPGYSIIGEIARGGMGCVYAGRELTLDREVAIKTLLPQANAVRFITESKITAKLPHPNIPPVYAFGVLADGSPYLAMKLIRGRTLADELKARAVVTAKLPRFLQIFEQIAQAVGFAHAQGIIHRDLKPANVMVGEFGEVQVMDWGLAKHLTNRQFEQQPQVADTQDDELTQAGAVMGTPAYMAPEQARGQAVDARADVFALGGILTAILTGKAVFSGTTARETISRAATGDTAEPLARLDGCGADAELIQLAKQCLAISADQRPVDGQAVAKLVADYRHGVDERLKRAETERASALVREAEQQKRRRVLIWAGGVVLVVLLLGLAGTGVGMLQAVQARKEEARQRVAAQAEEKRALEFRDKALDALRATTGRDVEKLLGEQEELTANETAYLKAIAKRWLIFARQEGTDEQSRAISAEGHFRVANLWRRIGRFDEAQPEYEFAVTLGEKLAADFPAVPNYRRDLANCHNNLAILLEDLGKRAEAEQRYRKGLALQEKLAADFPAVPDYRCDLALSYNNLGALLNDLGKRADAEEQYRKSLGLRKQLAGDFPAVPEYRNDLARSHCNLGNLLKVLGKRAEAEQQHKEGITLLEELARDFPDVPEYRSDLALSYNNLGALMKEIDNGPEVEAQFKKALALQEKLADDFPLIPDYSSDLALSHNNLGALMKDLGRSAESQQQYSRALELREKLVADFPDVPEYRSDLAKSHSHLGALLDDLGKRAKAEEQYQKALDIREKLAADFPTVPGYRVSLAKSYNTLGNRLKDLGKRAKAEEQLRKGLALNEQLTREFSTTPEYVSELGENFRHFGEFVRTGEKPADSLVWFDKAIKTLQPVYNAEPRALTTKQYLRDSYSNRAVAYDMLRRHTEAVKDWGIAVELSSPQEQPGIRAKRATSRLRAGQVAEAVAEITELTSSRKGDAEQWYNLACFYAVASGQLADQKTEYANRAMELLTQAVKGGFKDLAKLKAEKHFDPLREREDFKKLLVEFEKTFPAKAKSGPKAPEKK